MLAVLVALAVPLLSMHLGFSDAGNDPPNLTTRQAYDALARGFGPGFNGPLLIVTSQPAGSATAMAVVHDLDRRLRSVPDVAQVSPPEFSRTGDAAVIVAYPSTGPQAAQTVSLVAHLRSRVIPAAIAGTNVRVLVGGETAASIDVSSYLAGRLPWVIALVITLGFVLLLAMFRSVAIPVTAAAMNLVSIGASYGVIVAVYQWGWLGSLLGVSRTGPIDPWIPLMMFTIVFGLSMDYEVFLLSRIREEWNQDGANERAVVAGLAGTARVITAAALIMVCVFASFLINDPLRPVNIFALGLATAVFVDATLVRMVLVPAIMRLLGRANWWIPVWLDRAIPHLGVEVDPSPSPSAQPGSEIRVTS
jgi:RND superfamily putative drug exporter